MIAARWPSRRSVSAMTKQDDALLAAEFERIVQGDADRVLTLALRIVGDRSTAHDVSQEVFLSAWRTLSRKHPVRNWPAYLRTVTVRESLRQMKLRTPSGHEGLDGIADSARNSPPQAASRRELEDAVRRCLVKLSEKQALAFTLTKIEGLSYRECAESMGCSENAVRVHVHRAAHALARLLDGHL
jgi:RNA polymerase sigma-70 factor (ECF subfamily)